MRKKLISCILIVTMVICNSMVAWADVVIEGDNEEEVTATFEYEESDVFSVDISWGDLAFRYTDGEIVWEEEYYVSRMQGTWTNATSGNNTTSIVVTNRSNKEVGSTVTYSSDNKIVFADVGGVTIDTSEKKTLGSKAVNASIPNVDTRVLTVVGKPIEIHATSDELDSGVKLGTVTIKLE